jgi:hypothetical protein
LVEGIFLKSSIRFIQGNTDFARININETNIRIPWKTTLFSAGNLSNVKGIDENSRDHSGARRSNRALTKSDFIVWMQQRIVRGRSGGDEEEGSIGKKHAI